MIEDLPARYQQYLERFQTEVGAVAAGAFAKYNGRLIKKLSFEEFSSAYVEYTEISDRYYDSLDRGETINNVVVRILREKAANLVLKSPA